MCLFYLTREGGDENLTSAQGVLFLTLADKGGKGAQKCQKSADIVCEQYLICNSAGKGGLIERRTYLQFELEPLKRGA